MESTVVYASHQSPKMLGQDLPHKGPMEYSWRFLSADTSVEFELGLLQLTLWQLLPVIFLSFIGPGFEAWKEDERYPQKSCSSVPHSPFT